MATLGDTRELSKNTVHINSQSQYQFYNSSKKWTQCFIQFILQRYEK